LTLQAPSVTKKKTKKRQTKTTVGKKVTPMKKVVQTKPAPKKTELRTMDVDKKTTGTKTVGALNKQVREKRQSVETVPFALEGLEARSGE
jgi:hypothetical protein